MFIYNHKYSIKEIKLSGVKFKFGEGYFIVESDDRGKSWRGELFGVYPVEELSLSDLPSGECEILIDNGEGFRGSLIIDGYHNSAAGDKITFQGNGALIAK